MIIAGVTGTIGTGKSTVSRMFADLGAFVIDADQLAHEVVQPGKAAWQGIVDYFGRDILNNDQTLNRQKLADIVFSTPDKLHKLDSIVHPEVLKETQRLIEERKVSDPDGLVIEDIPLLLEVGPEVAHLMVEKIIVVYASEETQIKRLIARGLSEEDVRSRIKSQVAVREKMKYADFTVNNDGSLEETRQQVKAIYDKLIGH
ncbi:MAG: dephospho-CoA kinase [Dehalococcoidia bacterium]